MESFRLSKIADKILVIASFSSDPSGLIVQTPYAAMTAAEYFRDQGRDVLVVLDDLTTHAKFYREIALLAGRFPGRDSYPADMFYQHARLLERAGSFKADKGGSKTITCLPVAESLEGDITGLIQTNLMSMTDGHIFFDSNIFTKGRRPAVNPFLSVTRVGRQTQDKVGRGISHELSSLLVLYEKSETFSHFGAEMSEGMKMTMNTGKNIYDFFRQSSFETVPLFMQYLLFTFVWIGYWNSKEEGQMRRDIQKACAKYRSSKTVRQVVDDLCQGSGSLNELLGKVQKNLRNLESDLFL